MLILLSKIEKRKMMTDFRFSGGRKTNGPLIHALNSNSQKQIQIHKNKFKYTKTMRVSKGHLFSDHQKNENQSSISVFQF